MSCEAVPLLRSTLLAALATSAACSSTGNPATDAGAIDATAGPGPSCQTPADEDLTPHFDFSTDDGQFTLSNGSTCLQPPDPPPDGAADAAPPPPPPPLDGGAPPPPGDSIGRVSVGQPNPYGRTADQQMPDVTRDGDVASLDDFSRTDLLGTNGRHCETCHGNQTGWSSTPVAFRERFDDGITYLTVACDERVATNTTAASNDDLEPIFRTHDGANSPLADVSTPEAREAAYSMLLTRGVIRIGLEVPDDAEFELVGVDDPYRFASARELSLFRRTPVMANLRFHTTVMWDGRETAACGTLTRSLFEQARNAVTGHAQGDPPSDERVATMVRGELGIYSTQFLHTAAGALNADGARGGPTFLAQVPFYVGINSYGTLDPQGQAHDPEVFGLYDAWRELADDSEEAAARRAIAEGERLFNTRELTISGVSGFNDELGQPTVIATCGACHNAPNVGTNSQGRLMDIGVSDASRRTSDLPLYTFRHRDTGEVIATSDPGQALITKRWAHMNRFKVPSLRSLAVHAPYFHDGSAATLDAVVEYHAARFAMQLTPAEQAALVAFLSAL